MRVRFPAHLLAAAACALLAGGARAEDVIYGPDGAPTVVQHKLFTMTGRWEAAAAFDIALNTALVDQMGGTFDVTYHPNEWLDFGGEVMLNYAGLSTLAQNVRNDLYQGGKRSSAQLKDEFANDNQLRYGAFALARLAPVYGKFNLASELGVHFQAYLLGGAGVAQVYRESINLCADPGTSVCQNYQTSDAYRPVGQVGGGFRFYFGQRWSLRTEVRANFFASSYKEANDLTQPASGTPRSYLAAIVLFNGGVSYLF